jgi:hypothetical protein
LAVEVLALGDPQTLWQQGRFRGHHLLIEEGGADLHQLHAALPVQEARQRQFQLGVREKGDAAPGQLLPMGLDRALRPGKRRGDDLVEARGGYAPGVGRRPQPLTAALGAEGKGGIEQGCPAGPQCPRGLVEIRLRQEYPGAAAHRRQVVGATRREEVHRPDTEFREEPCKLVLDDVREGPGDQQRGFGAAAHRQRRRQVAQAAVLTLGEGGFDTAAGIGDKAQAALVAVAEALRGVAQVQLDHLGGAGADQEDGPDFRAPGHDLGHHTVQLFVAVRHAGQVAILQHRSREARLGEDHDARGRLHQVSAGARTDHEEKGVLDLAVQPDDGGQPAENGPLAALLLHRQGGQRDAVAGGQGPAHSAAPSQPEPASVRAGALSRALWNLIRNWAALTR